MLVACEFSGVVRDAFRRAGHDAWSCDLLPCEGAAAYHIEGSVLSVLDGLPWPYQRVGRVFRNDYWPSATWDLMIAHPPCTDLAVSGARWFSIKGPERMDKALAFVQMLMDAPIPRICIENPISVISSRIRKPDQIIQPWMFGHGETKATCLWLKKLPPLVPTDVVEGRENRIHRMPPSAERWKNRSRTYAGIAEAMAQQWGALSPADAAAATRMQPVGGGEETQDVWPVSHYESDVRL